jgi:uncharacterized protein YprB with RNaseH-like and TPR domain
VELRDRLRSLRTNPSAPAKPFVKPLPLPYLLPLENSHGITYFTDKIYIDYHGRIDLRNYPQISPETVRFLSLDRSIGDLQVKDLLFLDIETTGTAGGTGTYAFLVGLGFIEEGYFQIRQYFLHDLAQESSFLHAIDEFAGRFSHLVTYNGKCFDAQILKTRYLLHRRTDPLAEKFHIDMLFIARRLWKKRFRECDLMNLERNILGFHRYDDIPGYLIPGAYIDYLRYANSSLIQQVIHHNQWDIVSLAVLMARACLLYSDFDGLSPEEHFSLSLLYERQKDFHRAIQHQMQGLQDASTEWQNQMLIALARNLRRVKNHDQMTWLLARVQNESVDTELCRRLAILCEHDLKDPRLALEFVEAQIKRLDKYRGLSKRSYALLDEWTRRRDRLQRKVSLIS